MRKYEAEIDYCLLCKDVWLDRGEIDKIAKYSEPVRRHTLTRNLTTAEEIMIMIMIILMMITMTVAEKKGDSLKIYFILIN